MARYVVQKDARVLELTENDLLGWLRANKLTGLELARLEHEDDWRPLHELPIFRQAVPHVGDSRDAARRRVAKGFAWHLLFYGVVAIGLLGPTTLPALIWGFFVLVHAVTALPATWALVREGKLLGPGSSATALPGAAEAATPAALPAAAGSTAALPAGSDVDALVEDVRSMLARHAGEAEQTSTRLDGVAASLRELRDRIARLSALLAAQDRGALEEQLTTAQAALDGASEPEDQALRRREVEVLRESLATDDRARRALERLVLRERLGMQQLHQLRLDLARLEADAPGPEDLDERLEQIRVETEASAEVDALVGGRARAPVTP